MRLAERGALGDGRHREKCLGRTSWEHFLEGAETTCDLQSPAVSACTGIQYWRAFMLWGEAMAGVTCKGRRCAAALCRDLAAHLGCHKALP